MTLYIGIDPGAKGAVAFLRDTGWFKIIPMPLLTTDKGKGTKTVVSAPLLYGALRGMPDTHRIAIMEQVGAMPGQGVTSMFSFGRAVGVVEGVMAGLQVPLSQVAPQRWQKAMGVSGGKDGALARAIELFPGAATMLVGSRGGKLDGFADALLIAEYCRLQNRGAA